jgi:hypothetical protein
VSILVAAGACDSAPPARADYTALQSLPSIDPDAWLTSLLARHPDLGPDKDRVKGGARVGGGEVAVFADGRRCGFAFRQGDGIEDALFGQAPADAAHGGGIAAMVDVDQLGKEIKEYWGVAEGLTVTAGPSSGDAGSSAPVGVICGRYFAVFVLPRSFAGGSPDGVPTQGATSGMVLPDGRVVIVVGDDRIRKRLSDSIEHLLASATR